jgi:hypothetical protein
MAILIRALNPKGISHSKIVGAATVAAMAASIAWSYGFSPSTVAYA